MPIDQHRGRGQSHALSAPAFGWWERADPGMLPGGNANGLWEVADNLAQQLVSGDQHRNVTLASCLAPAFRAAIRQSRIVLERWREASAGDDRLSSRA